LHTQKSGNPFFICWILADYFKLEKTSFGYTLKRLLRISWEQKYTILKIKCNH